MRKHVVALTIILLSIIPLSASSLTFNYYDKPPIPPISPIIPNTTLNEWILQPQTNTGYEGLSNVLLYKLSLYAYIDFSEYNNETLGNVLIPTVYSWGISIPSKRVYISNGKLNLVSSNHLVLNTSVFRIVRGGTLTELNDLIRNGNVVIVAYMEYIDRKCSRCYSRGGIGFYDYKGFIEGKNVLKAGNYWISVLGSFNNRMVSWDFEGHWNINGGKWIFTEKVSRQVYEKNKQYIVIIGRSNEYIFGAMGKQSIWDTRFSSLENLYYIKDNVSSLLEVVSHKAHIAISRIEVYKPDRRFIAGNTEIPLIFLRTYNKYLRVLREKPGKEIRVSIDKLDFNTLTAYYSFTIKSVINRSTRSTNTQIESSNMLGVKP